MKNMKVRRKLLVSFLFLAVIVALAGSFSVVGLLTLNANQDTMYNLSVNSNYVNYMVENIQKQRVAYRDAVLHKEDPQQLSSIIAQLNELDANYKEIYSFLLEHLLTEKSRSFLQEINETYSGTFIPMRVQLLEAAQTGDQERTQQLLNDLAKPIGVITTASGNLIDYSTQYINEISEKDAHTAYLLITVVTVLSAILVIISIFLGLYISSQITDPLLKMKAIMDQVGNLGSLSFSSEKMDDLEKASLYKDEIGQSIASAIKMVKHFENASKILEQVADGDLSAEFFTLSEEDTIGISLKQMLDNLNEIFSEIHISSGQVSSGAGQVAQAAQLLASGSSEQAANIEEFSATLNEMQEKINHNAANSNKAREANSKTTEKLEESIHSMSEMLEAMKAIADSSRNITRVIKVIDDIAFQTNILSLNAAVEAARAGQHGKGFAVVANEVRNLAAKSAKAAKETAELIEGSSQRVSDGSRIVAKTNTDLEAAAENARESTQLIDQVAIDSLDQSKAIAEINHRIEQISTIVQANSATSEQSAAASEEMSAQAVSLDEIVAKFKLREE